MNGMRAHHDARPRALALSLTLIAIAFASQGCGPPIFLAALGIAGAGGGSSSEAAPSATISAAIARDELASADAVPVPFLLRAGRRTTVAVRVEFARAEAPDDFAPATPAPGTDGTPVRPGLVRGLEATRDGAPHVFIWDALADLEGGRARVRLRITPEGGTAAFTNVFEAGNEPPAVALVGTVGPRVERSVLVPLRIADSSGDDVFIRAEFREGAAGAFAPALPPPETIVDAIATTPEGGPYNFAWSSAAAAGGVGPRLATDVFLRIVVADRFGEAGKVELGPLVVDNNSDPVATLLEPALGPDRTHIIPLGVRAIDAESNETALVVQYALAGQPFPDLPEEITDPAARALIYADPEQRRALGIATEAPDLFEARVTRAGPADVLASLDPVAAGVGARLRPGQAVLLLDGPFAGEQRAIAELRLGTSEIVLDAPLPAPAAPGTRFLVDLAPGPGAPRTALPEGAGQTVLWDALADLGRTNVTVQVRVTPVDSEIGLAATSFPFEVRNGLFVERATPDVGEGGTSRSVATGDLDGDGRDDLVSVDVLSGTRVFFQLPSGELDDASVSIAALGIPPVVADVSGPLGEADGQPDLILGHHGSLVTAGGPVPGGVLLFPGGASGIDPGTFEVAIDFPGATNIVVADLAGSPAPDLAGLAFGPFATDSTSLGREATTVVIYERTGGGSFLAHPIAEPIARDSPTALAAGDLIPGGRAELAVAHASGAIDIYENAKGAFVRIATVEFPSHDASAPSGLAGIADLTGDGLPDLAALSSSALHVITSNGDGTFAAPETVEVPGAVFAADANALAFGDFLGDARLEVAVPDRESGRLFVFFRSADGRFEALDATGAAGYGQGAIAPGDLDSDGRTDLAVGLDRETVLLLRAPPFGAGAPLATPDEFPVSIAGDFTGDGRVDVIATEFISLGSSATLFRAAEGGGAFHPVALALAPNSNGLAIDLTADGRQDLVWLDFPGFEPAVVLAEQRPDGTLAPARTLGQPAPPGRGALGELRAFPGDWNGDGRPDLLVASSRFTPSGETPGLRVFVSAPGGDLVPEDVPDLGARLLAAGDLDLDGTLDLVVQPFPGGPLAIRFREGAGGPAEEVFLGAAGSSAARVRDVDADGRPDVIAAARACEPTGSCSVEVHIFYGTGGARAFEEAPPFASLPGTVGEPAVDAADMDGDGLPDLVVSALGRRESIEIASQVGWRTFGPGEVFSMRSNVSLGDRAPPPIDLGGDGHPDLLFHPPGALSLRHNRGRGATTIVSGRIRAAAPVEGVTVEARQLRSDGSAGELLARGTTGTSGAFILRIERAGPGEALLVSAAVADPAAGGGGGTALLEAAVAVRDEEAVRGAVVGVALTSLTTIAARALRQPVIDQGSPENMGWATGALFGGTRLDLARRPPVETSDLGASGIAGADAATLDRLFHAAAADALIAMAAGTTLDALLDAIVLDLEDGALDTHIGAYLAALAATLDAEEEAALAARLAAIDGTLAPPPRIDAIEPASGSVAGGTAITVLGAGFQAGTSVRIGGEEAAPDPGGAADSETAIARRTPPGVAGPRDIVVENPDGQSARLARGFRYFRVRRQLVLDPSGPIDFGAVPFGELAERTVRLRNEAGAEAPLAIVSVEIASERTSGFSVGPLPGDLLLDAEGEEIELVLSFQPLLSFGPATLRIVTDDDDDGRVVEVPLVAEVLGVVPPAAVVIPGEIAFGPVPSGVEAPPILGVIRNPGRASGPIAIDSVALVSTVTEFTLEWIDPDPSGGAIAPGEAARFRIRFAPGAAAAPGTRFEAALEVRSADPLSPAIVPVRAAIAPAAVLQGGGAGAPLVAPGPVSVDVYDAATGLPIEGALVFALDPLAPAPPGLPTTTDSLGHAEVVAPALPYDLHAGKPGYATRTMARSSAGTHVVLLRPDPPGGLLFPADVAGQAVPVGIGAEAAMAGSAFLADGAGSGASISNDPPLVFARAGEAALRPHFAPLGAGGRFGVSAFLFDPATRVGETALLEGARGFASLGLASATPFRPATVDVVAVPGATPGATDEPALDAELRFAATPPSFVAASGTFEVPAFFDLIDRREDPLPRFPVEVRALARRAAAASPDEALPIGFGAAAGLDPAAFPQDAAAAATYHLVFPADPIGTAAAAIGAPVEPLLRVELTLRAASALFEETPFATAIRSYDPANADAPAFVASDLPPFPALEPPDPAATPLRLRWTEVLSPGSGYYEVRLESKGQIAWEIAVPPGDGAGTVEVRLPSLPGLAALPASARVSVETNAIPGLDLDDFDFASAMGARTGRSVVAERAPLSAPPGGGGGGEGGGGGGGEGGGGGGGGRQP